MMAARHPSKVPAHCTPRLTNICFAKSGKHAPTADRRIVLAAKTEAALAGQIGQIDKSGNTHNCRYESIR